MTELTETAVTAKNPAAPVSSFEDSRTQAVYEVLVNDNYPPAGSNEHWEGWKARLIVDALFPIEAPAAVAVPTFEDFCKRHGLDPKKMDGHGGMWARVALDECRAITTQPAPVRGTPADLPPLPDPDLRDVGTKPEDIKNFLRGYATEYAKAALAACPTADSVTAPAAGAVAHTLSDAQIEAMPVWRNFVGLWPESRREIVDAVVDLLAAAPTPPAQGVDSVLEDAARLDWLLLHISGAEFRRIGVHYSGNARRADVDTARKQGANHD